MSATVAILTMIALTTRTNSIVKTKHVTRATDSAAQLVTVCTGTALGSILNSYYVSVHDKMNELD